AAAVEVVRTRDPGEVAAEASGADVVVVDLSAPGALAVPDGLEGVRTVGFGSHVDRELLRAARDAGYDQVLARSAFFSGLPRLLSGLETPRG
ncbi:MAG TPA: hypothetical protein VE152_14080, partial [Acidimicrobiales bacterium]|nr:hypothetical protein [Acidimicrobiales bacterium]